MGPQGKAVGDSFLWTEKLQEENSKTIKGGDWARPRPCISHSPSQESFPTTHVPKGSLEVKGELPTDLIGRIHIG